MRLHNLQDFLTQNVGRLVAPNLVGLGLYLLQEANRIFCQLYIDDPYNLTLARSFSDLGLVYCRFRAPEKAVECHQRAIEILAYMVQYESVDALLAREYDNLGEAYIRLCAYGLALISFEVAHKQHKITYKGAPPNRELSKSYYNLSYCRFYLGEYHKSLELMFSLAGVIRTSLKPAI